MKIYTYTITVILIIIFFVLFSHFTSYSRVNEDFNIQQTEHPMPEVIDLMLAKKQPTIFMYDIETWDGFDLLIGQKYEDIQEVLTDNKKLMSMLKNMYLKPFALPLTKNWTVNLIQQSQTWDNIPQQPQTITSYHHFFGNLSGLMMLCIISPKHTQLIEKCKKNNIDFKNYLTENGENEKLEYITIPIRLGYLVYIPFGWHYFLYCGQENSYCCYLDLKNITWFG